MRRKRKLRTLAGAAGTALLAGAADAAEYCVVCAQPDATYRCVAPEVSAAARDTGTQLLCIQDIARRAGHRTCTIERKLHGACEGPEWVVSGGAVTPAVVGPADRVPAPPAISAPTKPAPTPGQAFERSRPESKEGARQTYFPPGAAAGPGPAAGPGGAADPGAASGPGAAGAAPEAVAPGPKPLEKAGKALDAAGSAVGGAAKKTWDCVASLFSKC